MVSDGEQHPPSALEAVLAVRARWAYDLRQSWQAYISKH